VPRRKRQKNLDIRVIMGNPPYSSGDKDDENNKNVDYPFLDRRISESYVGRSSKSVGKSKIYDSYIRAIRWASDRIGNSGVIGFVTNAGFLEANTADGLRKCLAEEFSSLYVFHLRGNQRTSGELSRKEGGKIFGSGSRAPIAISLLVKNPDAEQHSQIYFHDIGDYLSQADKLEKISGFASIAGISEAGGWHTISPDVHGDWFGQRSDDFEAFIKIGRKSNSDGNALFSTYSMGIKTNRDDWVYGYSKLKTERRIVSMIDFFNQEVARYKDCSEGAEVDEFVDRDKIKIKWTSDVLTDIEKGRIHSLDVNGFVKSHYRPFSKQWVYSNKSWNWSRHLMPRYFPDANAKNEVICVTGLGSTKDFCAFLTNTLPDLELVSKGQCFPKYVYNEPETIEAQSTLFAEDVRTATQKYRQDALTDEGLAHFQSACRGEQIGKEDVFYYVYGLLHCPRLPRTVRGQPQ
jgi:predicted helicase